MYKAVVVEKKGRYAAILKEDGTFAKIKRDCEVGDELLLPEERKVLPISALRKVAAAAAVAICVSGTYYYTVPACSYVSLDVNPSIEFGVNRLDRVVNVTALNEDAQSVTAALESSSVYFNTLEEALSKTEKVLEEQGYSGEDGEYYLLNISSDSEDRGDRLERQIDDAFAPMKKRDDFHMKVGRSPRERRDEAIGFGISPGRYEEIRRIQGDGDRDIPPDRMRDAVDRYGRKPIYDLFVESGEIAPPPEKPAGPPPEEMQGQPPEDMQCQPRDDGQSPPPEFDQGPPPEKPQGTPPEFDQEPPPDKPQGSPPEINQDSEKKNKNN